VKPAKVNIAGEGLRVENAVSHPAGTLFSGGYDAEKNELYLSTVIGHPRGVSLAGGEASNECVSGLRVLITDDRNVYWATDSMSLPRGLTASESIQVQDGLANHFRERLVHRIEKLEDISK
jgi:hypothetical protein